MRKNFFFLLFISYIFYSENSFAQSTFQKYFPGANNDWGKSIKETKDGGYVMTGETESYGAGGKDVFLTKINTIGQFLWSKTFGGTNDESGNCIIVTSDSGFAIIGYTTSFGAGGQDVYLIRTNKNGDTLWTRTFGAAGNDVGACIQQTRDGGFIITGTTSSFSGGQIDVYLIKTNANGDTLWTKDYGDNWHTYNSTSTFIQQTSDNGYIITGTIGGGNNDLYLIKTDSIGNKIWSNDITAFLSSASLSVTPTNSYQTSDGGYIVLGWGNGAWLMKFNSSGASTWAKIYQTNLGTFGGQITSDSGYILCGVKSVYNGSFMDECAWLIKTNQLGDTLWTRVYGWGTSLYSVNQTSNGRYALVGAKYNSAYTIRNAYLVKTDSIGWSGCSDHGDTSATQIISPTNIYSQNFHDYNFATNTLISRTSTIIMKAGILNTLCQCSLNISASCNNPICNGGTLILSTAGGIAYSWSGPSNFVSSQQMPSILNVTAANSGTYTVTVIDSGGCMASALINVVVNSLPSLNLKFFTQGYYINGGTLKKVLHNEGVDTNASSTNVDTVIVELHNASSPYAVAESYKGILQTNGTLACSYSCNVIGHSYYIAVKHRNTIQTWTAAPVAFSAATNYDFTTAQTQAYGNNMIQMQAGKWAFYSGDINQNENVDLQDFLPLDYGIVHGLSGYYASDLNGDGNVDLQDFPMFIANNLLGIFSQQP